MKNRSIIYLLFTAAILTGFHTFSLAQVTANASASANVVIPVSLTKNVDMNFGNAAVSVVSGGTIVLTPSGSRSTGGTGVTLPATAGTVAAARFTVTGAPTYTYSITLPSNVTISGPGTATMVINVFTSTPSTSGTLGSGGTQILSVGATLTVSPAQTPGVYTNAGAVPVTVNYN